MNPVRRLPQSRPTCTDLSPAPLARARAQVASHLRDRPTILLDQIRLRLPPWRRLSMARKETRHLSLTRMCSPRPNSRRRTVPRPDSACADAPSTLSAQSAALLGVPPRLRHAVLTALTLEVAGRLLTSMPAQSPLTSRILPSDSPGRCPLMSELAPRPVA